MKEPRYTFPLLRILSSAGFLSPAFYIKLLISFRLANLQSLQVVQMIHPLVGYVCVISFNQGFICIVQFDSKVANKGSGRGYCRGRRRKGR